MDSPKEVVRLLVNMEWWLWRGYCTFDRSRQTHIFSQEVDSFRHTRKDPIDFVWPKYEAESAFPLTKPAIDVFGPPRRSRKQRGWYQVQSPSRREHSSAVSLSPPRSAEDLPIDVVYLIAELGLRDSRPPLGHDFLMCASVCRRWAKALRPNYFRSSTIHTQTGAATLYSMVRDPESKMSQHVRCVYLVATLPCTPFLHSYSVLRKLLHHKSDLDRAFVTIVGPQADSHSASMRSIYWQLPRTLPQSFSRHIDTLRLEKLHFSSFLDLIHVVRELPDLKEIWGHDLAWTEQPKIPMRPLSRRFMRPNTKPILELMGCPTGQYWLGVLFLVPTLATEDIRILTLIRAIEARLSLVRSFQSLHHQRAVYVTWRRAAPRSPSLKVSIYHTPGDGRSQSVRDITLIEFEFQPGTSMWISDLDWDAVARAAASSSDLECVRIYVRARRGSRGFRRRKFPEHGPLGQFSRDMGTKLELLVEEEDT